MRPLSLVAGAVLLSASLAARASSIDYTFTGSADGQPITVTFNTPSDEPFTPTVTSSGVSFMSDADSIAIDGTPVGSASTELATFTSDPGVSWIGVPGLMFAFDGDLFSCASDTCALNTGSFAMDIAATNAELDASGLSFDSGNLAVSETPEPSSIALLATGILVGAGTLRRRFVA